MGKGQKLFHVENFFKKKRSTEKEKEEFPSPSGKILFWGLLLLGWGLNTTSLHKNFNFVRNLYSFHRHLTYGFFDTP
jgi:hypothetical protein